MINYEDLSKGINELVELRQELINQTKKEIKFVENDYLK
jgi:hypothetical protein